MKYRLLTILILFSLPVFFNSAVAQQALSQQEIRRCLAMEVDSLIRAKNPALGSLADFETDLQQKIAERRLRMRSGKVTAELYRIPVVVHIIHNGEAEGTGTNLSDAQIQSQIDVLNEDFRRIAGTRGNDDPRGVDIEVEFCPAVLDPNGRPMAEPGIRRYNGNRATWPYAEVESTLKPATQWNPDQYFNIWVVNFTGTSAGGTTLGYAQFPINSRLDGLDFGASSRQTDGVVILSRAFGRGNQFPNLDPNYNLGRTLTHEAGHFLGLRHIWGDGGCDADDFCSDTPLADSPTSGCPVGRRSCGVVNMIENYMDYTDDACMSVFTEQQKERMRTVLDNSPRRVSLRTSGVCANAVAAAPVANFIVDNPLVLRGGTAQFTDLSSNFPTSWAWEFEGGEPATSTVRNPTVEYNASGTYRVRLRAANANGADTLVREEYIEVSTEGLCSPVTNFPETATRTTLRAPLASVTQGYVAGHNNLRQQAKAEFFDNELGYLNLSGVGVWFGYVRAGSAEATVTILAWNGRGVQGSPGAVLERKEVLLSQIQQDIASNRPTQVTFDRSVPLFGQGFHVGIELSYGEGDTVALVTTQNNQVSSGTAWEQDSTGTWSPYTLSQGLNLAHDITANVGMNPSIQISASNLIINPGESVSLIARGASIFSWQSNPTLSDTLGSQVFATPTQTTTYVVTGGGLDLCTDTASVTVVVRSATGVNPFPAVEKQLSVFPNPNQGQFTLRLANDQTGAVQIRVLSAIGSQLLRVADVKSGNVYEKSIDVRQLPQGMYIVEFTMGDVHIRRKVVKTP